MSRGKNSLGWLAPLVGKRQLACMHTLELGLTFWCTDGGSVPLEPDTQLLQPPQHLPDTCQGPRTRMHCTLRVRLSAKDAVAQRVP